MQTESYPRPRDLAEADLGVVADSRIEEEQ